MGNSERSLTLWEDLPMKICLQSGANQIDNKCLRICEPYGVRSPPFLSDATIACLFFISLQYGMPHSSSSISSKSKRQRGENAWLQCPLVAAGPQRDSCRGSVIMSEVVFTLIKNVIISFFCAAPRH